MMLPSSFFAAALFLFSTSSLSFSFYSSPPSPPKKTKNDKKNTQARSFITYVPSVGDAKPRTITLIPGDGIGPEISTAVEEVVEALGAPIEWERFPGVSGSTPRGEPVTEVPADVLASIRRNKVCFKGTLFTPLSEHNTSTQSLNVQLRKGERERGGGGEKREEAQRKGREEVSAGERVAKVIFTKKKSKKNSKKTQLSTSTSTSATASTPPGCPLGSRGSTLSSFGKTPKVSVLFASFLFFALLFRFPETRSKKKNSKQICSPSSLSPLSAPSPPSQASTPAWSTRSYPTW